MHVTRTDAVAGRGNLSHWGKVWEGAELSPQIFFPFRKIFSGVTWVIGAVGRTAI